MSGLCASPPVLRASALAAGPVDQKSVVLVAPTQAEYAVVRAAVAGLTARGGLEVRLSGMGPDSAAALCQSLEATAPALRSLALIGWAGGLVPELAAGAIVLGDMAMDLRGERAPCTVIQLAGAQVGPLLTASEPLLTGAAKTAQRSCGALAVEMEAYPMAVWAQRRGLPFVHARVILDAADEPLPDLGDALDLFGRVHAGRLVCRLAAQPRLAVALWRLARRTRALSPVMSGVSRAVAQSLQEMVAR